MLKVVIITVLAVQLVNTVAALIIDSEEDFLTARMLLQIPVGERKEKERC